MCHLIATRDIAKLYQVETKRVNEAVKNNPDKIPNGFIILDRNKLYSCGVSFKDLGKKCFTINKFNDKEYLNKLLNVLDV